MALWQIDGVLITGAFVQTLGSIEIDDVDLAWLYFFVKGHLPLSRRDHDLAAVYILRDSKSENTAKSSSRLPCVRYVGRAEIRYPVRVERNPRS